MDKYSEFLAQKIFMIEHKAMKYSTSSDIKDLQEFVKDVLKITTGSPSYIKKRRENEQNR